MKVSIYYHHYYFGKTSTNKWRNLLEKRERIHKVKKRGHKLSTRKRSSSMQKQKTYKDCENSIISEEDCAIPTHLGP